MSKIDEILYNLELINGVLDDEEYQLICNCVNKIRAVLEQLRPYVELAEMIIDGDITKDVEFNDRKEYSRFAKLYQQIKEQ